ncbi:MAG: sialate O-acetylesterase [Colwellia sp.]|nr:sialate O-acetylesterase [Colwellia sp.]
MINFTSKITITSLALSMTCSFAKAEVILPNIFSDHMVLQRGMANPVWGKATPGEKISVSIADQKHNTVADANGEWQLKLAPLKAGGSHELTVTGSNTFHFEDVLVGEVWLCSGQSNMELPVNESNSHELEIASANYPNIRLITAPRPGAETEQFSFDDQWQATSPESVGDFSAACYFFGRRLHNTLNVPIGLINTAWGGARIEAFMPRKALEDTGEYLEYLTDWDRRIIEDSDREYAEKLAKYEAWQSAGSKGEKHTPLHARVANHAPGSIYNGLIHPVVGYGIKGTIWYQGESSTDRPYQYRRLFPLLINTWRDLWGQGDFPFYWVQLADYKKEFAEPNGGAWAEVREAQTMTLSLPNTGEAIAIDLGEARDIHPRDKQTVAKRLVRHALAKDYGYNMASDSPSFSSMQIASKMIKSNAESKAAGKTKDKVEVKLERKVAVITFDHVATSLYSFDVDKVLGFAIAGEDQKFVWAKANIISENQVEVYSDEVVNPVAVRYGFEFNPVVNLYDKNGLPVTPFRTDDWPRATSFR